MTTKTNSVTNGLSSDLIERVEKAQALYSVLCHSAKPDYVSQVNQSTNEKQAIKNLRAYHSKTMKKINDTYDRTKHSVDQHFMTLV